MAKSRDPNEHVPPRERQDHPAVQRMKRQKTMQKVKRWAFLIFLLGGLLGVYAWRLKQKGVELTPENIAKNLAEDVSSAGVETIALLEEEYARREKPLTDAELDEIVRKKRSPAPPPVEPAPPTTAPPTPTGGTEEPPKPAPPPPPEPRLSTEEEKAKGMIKEANAHWDKCLEHYDRFRTSKDQSVRKKEIYAAFDEVEKAKRLYNQALELLGDNDWLVQRHHRCMEVYKELRMKKGQY